MSVALPAPAQAQALQPVVDVCTGISVNDSALRDILSRTVVPTATGVEALYDNLLTISIGLTPLLSIPDVDLGIAQTTADIAAGNTVSLQVLDTNGNIVAPGNCNVTTDGYALNTPAGIAIGGNQISGLGSGTKATAAELDAIAFGNGANTGVGATGAVALGTNASVTAANGVALGAGSTNTRGALAGYTAYGITGPVDSAGTVSFGSPGAERQLTNVAPGTAATDAATVGQVQGAVAAATADSVQYDDASHTTVTLDGAGGTRITNVSAGALAAGSTDAVNGSQLFATNQQVAANTAGVATNAGNIATLQTQVTTNTGNIGTLQTQVATNTGNIGTLQTQVTANTGNIAAVQAGVTTNAAGLATLDDQAVKYDGAAHDSVTFDGAAGTRLTNVTAGTISATSTDAVNGAQLYATNQAIAAATGTPGLALTYDDPTLATATLGGVGGTTVDNVRDGTLAAGSMEAVNGGQLFATNQQVGANTTSISLAYNRLDTLDTSVTNLNTQVAGNTTAITGIDARVTNNTTQLAAVQAQVNNVPVGYVSNTDGRTPSTTPTDTAAFAGASGGTVRVTNVAAGQLAAGSTDAVNGAQLAATNVQVAANRADIVTLSATVGVGSAAPVQYSNAATPTVANGGTPSQDVTLVGANAAQPVRVHNVANGTAATDAANFGQLQSAVTQVQSQMAQGFTDARAYTDMRIADIGFDLKNLRKGAYSGTAAAMALASIPQTMNAGQSMIGGAIGHYRGETAFGVGFSTTAGEDVVIKASGTMDTHGKGGFAAGAGFAF